MEFVRAKVLGTEVEGERVVEVNARGNSLYYYPSSVEKVICLGPKLNKTIEQTGIQAKVPVELRESSLLNWEGVEDNTIDTVVSVGGALEASGDAAALLGEAARVLVPGGKLVLVEKVQNEGFGGNVLQGLLGGSNCISGNSLQVLGELNFTSIKGATELEVVSPFIVCSAKKLAKKGFQKRK